MAGIGFVLRKLSQEDFSSAGFRAYMHAAIAATGPWLITIVTIAGITLMAYKSGEREALFEFRLLLIYNFSFSLVFSSPIFVIATRYLADKLYRKDFKAAPGLLIGVLFLLYGLLLPIALPFYMIVASLDMITLFSVMINLLILTALLLVSLFISIVEDYRTVTRGYCIGGSVSIIAAWFLLKPFGAAGLMFGFTIGLCVILAILVAQIFIEYNYDFRKPTHIFRYFKELWPLALGALIYNTAAWIDKWIMWSSQESQTGKSGLIFYDTYDSALFLCQLTIIPAMAMFLLTVETGFFEKCRKFYGDIVGKVTYTQIERNHQEVIIHLQYSARNLFILQGGISALVIFMAPEIFEFFNLNYLQMGIFRLGVLGAFFHVQILFIMVLLTYFDTRKEPLWIALIFLFTNAGFTFFIMTKGIRFYGYGYFISALVTFVGAVIIFSRMINNLPYRAFIKNNQSIYNKRSIKHTYR